MTPPDGAAAPSWAGRLELRHRAELLRGVPRTVRHDRHDGPLRVLASLYPEGPAVCHSVLVHPPGGIVGGDRLVVDLEVAADAQALVTTPGATRFYRTTGALAGQHLAARVEAGGRLEWLPLETIAYSGCRAENTLRFALAEGAETIGWDVLALGLPAAGRDFEHGRFTQSIALQGAVQDEAQGRAPAPTRWLERGSVDAADRRLLDSPLGWDGQRVLATLWFAAGTPLAPARREALLEAARSLGADDPLAARAGTTAPHPTAVVLRVLAPRVEPAMALLVRVWSAWRQLGWGRSAIAPRVWRT